MSIMLIAEKYPQVLLQSSSHFDHRVPYVKNIKKWRKNKKITIFSVHKININEKIQL